MILCNHSKNSILKFLCTLRSLHYNASAFSDGRKCILKQWKAWPRCPFREGFVAQLLGIQSADDLQRWDFWGTISLPCPKSHIFLVAHIQWLIWCGSVMGASSCSKSAQLWRLRSFQLQSFWIRSLGQYCWAYTIAQFLPLPTPVSFFPNMLHTKLYIRVCFLGNPTCSTHAYFVSSILMGLRTQVPQAGVSQEQHSLQDLNNFIFTCMGPGLFLLGEPVIIFHVFLEWFYTYLGWFPKQLLKDWCVIFPRILAEGLIIPGRVDSFVLVNTFFGEGGLWV